MADSDFVLTVTPPSPDFLFPLVHDIRAPLRAILSFSALLEERGATTLARNDVEDLQRIRRAANQLRQLSDALERLAEASVEPRESTEVDLAEIFKQHFARLQESEPERTTPLEVSGPVPVRADRRHLDILAYELLHNAWMATRDFAGARISLCGESTPRGTGFWLRDTGVGIPEGSWQRLSRPFALIHPRSVWPGAGLGLCIARAVVQRYQGRIVLRPNSPTGVQVEGWLPR